MIHVLVAVERSIKNAAEDKKDYRFFLGEGVFQISVFFWNKYSGRMACNAFLGKRCRIKGPIAYNPQFSMLFPVSVYASEQADFQTAVGVEEDVCICDDINS